MDHGEYTSQFLGEDEGHEVERRLMKLNKQLQCLFNVHALVRFHVHLVQFLVCFAKIWSFWFKCLPMSHLKDKTYPVQ